MGIMDNLGEQARKHEQKIENAIEKGGDTIDQHTGGKFAGQVDKGQEFLNRRLDSLAGSQQDGSQPQPAADGEGEATEQPSA